jgi:superfamily I DNA and/or RNA helicase
MVTASLFKQYFESADPQIKSSLFTQYRMHPHIMDTINHFYENRLVCGINNPDQARNHGLLVNNSQCEYLSPNKHVVWIDSSQDPCGRKYYETKMQQKGCYNELEARILISVLIDINNRLKELNQTKSVGIISFYAMQIRQLNILLKQHISRYGKLSNVRWRISTVDKFQGREQDLILVSLVRNKQTVRKSAKAFVAQFERVNVAMSRARELLIVTGAKDMLADYPVLVPNMDREGYTQSYTYKNIMEQVNLRGSFYPSSFIISPEDWKSMTNNRDGRNRYDNRKS